MLLSQSALVYLRKRGRGSWSAKRSFEGGALLPKRKGKQGEKREDGSSSTFSKRERIKTHSQISPIFHAPRKQKGKEKKRGKKDARRKSEKRGKLTPLGFRGHPNKKGRERREANPRIAGRGEGRYPLSQRVGGGKNSRGGKKGKEEWFAARPKKKKKAARPFRARGKKKRIPSERPEGKR